MRGPCTRNSVRVSRPYDTRVFFVLLKFQAVMRVPEDRMVKLLEFTNRFNLLWNSRSFLPPLQL